MTRGILATGLKMFDSLASTWRHGTYDRLMLHLPAAAPVLKGLLDGPRSGSFFI
jgi:hypothetical protein